MANRNLKKDDKKNAQSVPFFARFLVGQDEERALVRMNQKLAANAMRLPPGASAPLVQVRSIDDVPVMALTLWGPGYDDVRLRQIGGQF